MKKSIFKVIIVSFALLLVCGTAQAQFGRRLGKAIDNAAKRTVERKAEQKTEQAVGKAIDKATDPDTYKDKDGGESNKAGTSETGASMQGKDTPQQGAKAAEMAYAKSDFVPGDEIFFEDDLANEQMGEFPSQWDMESGNAEIASINGVKCINLIGYTIITPLIEPAKKYLPDVFTIEYDVYGDLSKGGSSKWNILSTFRFPRL